MEEKKIIAEKMMDKELVLVRAAVGGRKSDFYVVNLEAEEAIKTPVTRLLNEGGQGDLVALGPVIYNVGGKTSAEDLNPISISGDHHIHLGASCLELSKPHILQSGSCKWKAAPLMNFYRYHPCCAVLGGRIYALGGSAPDSCVGEVFVPELGKWQVLPSLPENIPEDCYHVSTPVLSDEKNDRLLVHFEEGDSLYAYYAATSKWELLSQESLFARFWLPAAALVDDVLYFHSQQIPHCIAAYDLLSRQWLEVVYTVEFHLTACYSEFQNMLNLGNGILCLANFCPFFEDEKPLQTDIQFLKFRVERINSEQVRVTPFDVTHIIFQGCIRVTKFIPF